MLVQIRGQVPHLCVLFKKSDVGRGVKYRERLSKTNYCCALFAVL